jgi:hypothetical protein
MVDEAGRLLRKIASELYDQSAGSGDRFDLTAIMDRLERDQSVAALGRQLVRTAIEAAVRSVDEQRRDRPEDQGRLFGDLDRVLAIGDGVRRRKGSCDGDDYAKHIAIIAHNAAKVASAAAKEQNEYALLLPYFAQGLTVEQAVERGAGA